MHPVLHTPRSTAQLLLALTCLAALAGAAGCGGSDLAKANFEKTTVAPQPGSGGTGTVPDGPVDDPALTPDKLREIDACKLLEGDTTSQLGTAEEPQSSGPDACRVSITDPGGKALSVNLTVGESMFGGADQATGGIEGLPLTESKQDDSCFAKLLTSEAPGHGIGLQIGYPGGDPCGAGRKVAGKIVQRLKNDPPKLSVDDGSLIPVDACALTDGRAAKAAVGDGARKVPYNLHGCMLSSAGPSAGVTFTFRYPPQEQKNSEEVELSDSVTALVSYDDPKDPRCKVEWKHRDLPGDQAESVRVDYSDYNGKVKAAKACEKATALAKAVAGKLPKA